MRLTLVELRGWSILENLNQNCIWCLERKGWVNVVMVPLKGENQISSVVSSAEARRIFRLISILYLWDALDSKHTPMKAISFQQMIIQHHARAPFNHVALHFGALQQPAWQCIYTRRFAAFRHMCSAKEHYVECVLRSRRCKLASSRGQLSYQSSSQRV